MTGGPRNAAAERMAKQLAEYTDDEGFLDRATLEALLSAEDGLEGFTGDYVRDDRRRFVSLPPGDAREMVENQLEWFEMGDGKPIVSVTEVVAVRGERLVLARLFVGYRDGTGTEVLNIALFDGVIEKVQRDVRFDPDDLDAALEELDTLHARVEAGTA